MQKEVVLLKSAKILFQNILSKRNDDLQNGFLKVAVEYARKLRKLSSKECFRSLRIKCEQFWLVSIGGKQYMVDGCEGDTLFKNKC